MPLNPSDGRPTDRAAIPPATPISKATHLHLLLGLIVFLGLLMWLLPPQLQLVAITLNHTQSDPVVFIVVQFTLFFVWGLGMLLLPLWTRRLPFWPAPWIKGMLWVNAIISLWWLPLMVKNGLVATALACLGGPGLILAGTVKAMGLRATAAALYQRAATCAQRFPLLMWAVAASPLFWVDDTRVLWFLVMVGGAIVELCRWLMRQRPTVEKERPDVLRAPETLDAMRQTCRAAPGVFAGAVDGQPLHVSVEDRASVIGPPGSGKTAFLVTQLLEWAESGRPFVCLDVKPEIYGIVRQRLETQGSVVHDLAANA